MKQQQPITDLRQEAGRAIITGLKQAGINFIASLPCSGFGYMELEIKDDPDFIHAPVAHEHDAIGLCAGASMAGKKPVFIAQNSGLIMATYALLDVLYFFGGFPMLLLLDHHGGFGDEAGYMFLGYGVQQTPMLEKFQILYNTISLADFNNIPTQIVLAQRTVESYGRPAALLLSREEI